MEPVEFLSSGSQVQGYFFPAPGKTPLATVLFLQGFPGVEGDELICARLAQQGVNVLTFNYRGTFCSKGEFSFSNVLADIGAALEFLLVPGNQARFRVDPQKLVLGGWSLGAGIAPTGAAEHPGFSRLFVISGRDFSQEARRIQSDPAYASQVAQNLDDLSRPDGPVTYQGNILTDLVENMARFDTTCLAPLLMERDILLIGGWDDTVSPIEDHLLPFYRMLVKNLVRRVRIEVLPDDHAFSHNQDRLVELIVTWLSSN